MKKNFLLSLLFLSAIVSAQKQADDFRKFARTQDSLSMKAYERRDDKTYDKLTKDFVARYNKLPDSVKVDYRSQLINLYYNFCCIYSLQNNKPMALDYFEKCVKMGYTEYDHTLEDTDLDNIRKEERYKTLERQLRSVGDYKFILSRAEAYNTADERPLPEFTYQPASDPNLTALRKAFNLDSIAGSGNEVSRILNLLHWIHNLVPHNGSIENPAVKNAMSMIAVCKKEKRGLNCRGLATVLNECYLSLGIPSRFITCMPKDSLGVDNDCHVINMVYSNSLKKWLWIDPTFDAYVMNEKGEMLSIEEVRERIIRQQPLILNPDANWNHQSSQTKDYYLLHYMAKNLYKMNCAVRSEYDTETGMKGKAISYIQLLPLEYYKQKPDREEYTSKYSGTINTTYHTNNPALFWKAPTLNVK